MHNKQSLPTCAGIALALLVSVNAPARADQIWNYNWAPNATQVVADGGGSGYLQLTNEPSNTATGSSNTVVTNIQAFSTAPFDNPDVFNHAAVTFTLQLQDVASKASDTIPFNGYFSGTLTDSSANIQLTFTSPTTEIVTLGGNQYAVVVGTYSPPGPPGVVNSGGLNAFVTVTPLSTPEPATLTLACLAFPFVGLCGWWKRRTNRIAIAAV